MKQLIQSMGEETRVGSLIALVTGGVTGLLVGIGVVSLQNAELVVGNFAGRLVTVLFFASAGALASLLLLPVELLVATSKRLGRNYAGINTVWLYTACFLLALLFLHLFFHISFNLVRDIVSTQGITLLAGLLAGTGITIRRWRIRFVRGVYDPT